MVSHKNQVVSEGHDDKAKDPKEISLSCESHPSISVHNRAQDKSHPTCSSTLKEDRSVLDETSYPSLHSSEVPFIINVKQEEGM